MKDISKIDIINFKNNITKQSNKNGELLSQTYLKSIHKQISAIFNLTVRYYGLKENPTSIVGKYGK